MEAQCQICRKRINDWELVNGKHQVINNLMYHKSCLADVTIRDIENGKYKPKEEP